MKSCFTLKRSPGCLAETDAAARAGAARVRATYEPLTPILSIQDAIAQESFHGPVQVLSRGDASAALKNAPNRLSGELSVGGQDHFYLETHVSWAVPDPDGTVHVTSSTQHPSETQGVVANVLGVPASQVTVTCLRMGGGFGGKESQAAPYAALAALGAHVTGRPVRVRLRREHDMVLSGKRHPFWGRYEVGFSDEGLIGGRKARALQRRRLFIGPLAPGHGPRFISRRQRLFRSAYARDRPSL